MSVLLVDRCRDIARRIAEGELREAAGAMAILELVHEREREASDGTAQHIISSMRKIAA
jgi:hypothetical protein